MLLCSGKGFVIGIVIEVAEDSDAELGVCIKNVRGEL